MRSHGRTSVPPDCIRLFLPAPMGGINTKDRVRESADDRRLGRVYIRRRTPQGPLDDHIHFITCVFRLSDLGLKPCRFVGLGKFGRTLEGP